MENDAEFYNDKWARVIRALPTGGQYRFDLRQHGYNQIVDAIPAGSRVFDYACGLGIIDKNLEDKGCKVSGCDFSSVAIDYVNSQCTGTYRVTDEIFGGPYDYIIAIYVLEHLKDPISWVKGCLQKADTVICAIPRDFRHAGEHVDMAWNNWEHFYELFSGFNVEKIDKYGKNMGAFNHPIIKFTKGKDMHISLREECNAADEAKKKVVQPKKKVVEKKKVTTVKKRGRKKIEITEDVTESTQLD
jgi:hypothetical protein